MKISTKKITVEQEIYIADDGTQFDDIDECEAYEMRLEGERLDMYTYEYVRTSVINDCWYAKLDTNEEVSAFINLCKFDGVSSEGIEKVGLYMYTEGGYGRSKEAWTNLSEVIKRIGESEETEGYNG